MDILGHRVRDNDNDKQEAGDRDVGRALREEKGDTEIFFVER